MLLVDDNRMLRSALGEYFQLHEAFVTDEAPTAADGLRRIKSLFYDVILMNVGLPDMDGRAVCRLMRRRGVKSPIILLSGAATAADIILGLNAGASLMENGQALIRSNFLLPIH